MRRDRKRDVPTQEVRRFLEPGPVARVGSAWKQQRDIMTLGWHRVLEFSPSLLACCISSTNHRFALIRRSRRCVIDLPTADLVDTVVGIGNSSGADLDKFAHFGLTAVPATHVAARPIAECYASFECRLHDGSQVAKHGRFVWEVAKAHVAASPKRHAPCTTGATAASCSPGPRSRGGACSSRSAVDRGGGRWMPDVPLAAFSARRSRAPTARWPCLAGPRR